MSFGIIFFTFVSALIVQLQAQTYTMLNQLNYIASQSPYVTYMFKKQFSSEDISHKSLDMALHSCQQSFNWQRWNCPSNDFYRRYKNQPQWLDAEDAYVNAILSAAILYNINKDCTSGLFTDCGCNEMSCSDNTQKAEELYRKHVKQTASNQHLANIKQHNFNAVATLMRQSLVQNCQTPDKCLQTLKPFNEIAAEIYKMYENAVQLTKTVNAKILWCNIPLDEFVFNAETPNYCEIEAVPGWNGLRGRQCSHTDNSCQRLCTDCGHKVSLRHVITEHQCNCKFMWNFQVKCETCMTVEQEQYCQ